MFSNINSFSSPFDTLINNLTVQKGSPIDYEDLKTELTKKDGDSLVYNLAIKEDDAVSMIFYTNTQQSVKGNDFATELENSCRSLVIDKKTLKPIASQYNKILYNKETVEFLNGKNWSKIIVQKCYEGTLVVVFFHNNKWYITTRRCLDAHQSSWIKDNSYCDMFLQSIKGKFSLDDLNKNFSYHFVLIHYKNKNIVSYDWLGKEYMEIFHLMTVEKNTLKEVKYKINNIVKYIPYEKYNNIDELFIELNKQDTIDRNRRKITLEGYVLKCYTGEIFKSPFVVVKLQTKIYDTIVKIKPNNSNMHQCFLELYQTNKLSDYLPFFTDFSAETIKRIHLSMQNMAKELLDLYHITRGKNNQELYEALPSQYKKCIYEIHGLYIKYKEEEGKEENEAKDAKDTYNAYELPKLAKSINVYDVYHYLKSLKFSKLRQLYFDRAEIFNDMRFVFLNRNCINTKSQTTLMMKI